MLDFVFVYEYLSPYPSDSKVLFLVGLLRPPNSFNRLTVSKNRLIGGWDR